jgi:hypothetical protein
MNNKKLNDLINEIKTEMLDFYNINVNEEVIKNFVLYYFKYKRNIVFDTTEREDLLYYLEELELVKLKQM